MLSLHDPVVKIKGVGEKTAATLKKLGIETISQLISYYPRDYECFEPPVHSLEGIDGNAAVCLQITGRVNVVSAGRWQIVTTAGKMPDGTLISLKWFNMAFLRYTLKPGFQAVFRGKTVRGKNGSITMEQPAFYPVSQYESLISVLQPVYSLTKGITSNALCKMIGIALEGLEDIPDLLDERIKEKYRLVSKKEAIRCIHQPKSRTELIHCRRTVVFEEFYLFLSSMRQLKEELGRERNHFAFRRMPEITELIRSLPYSLTNSQKEVLEQIRRDLEGEGIMNRLVQGDVGSGKTILAFLALYEMSICGYQGVMMAPTEVLAEQHYENLLRLSDTYHLGLKPVLLTGSLTAKQKRLTKEQIRTHQCDIIIGTHALIQDDVDFHDLALVITDEQHRFGVKQRQTLKEKGWTPHTLVMSATPIPRTLAMILYGDFHISLMKDMPAARKPIKNCVVGKDYRKNAYQFILNEIKAGHQAYVICPMVEESELMDAENVTDYTKTLRSVFPEDVIISPLHGRMKPSEKNEIMRRFGRNEIQILVSTTVIEVGIDVPNATVIMIENAERFGLAQLHQLRGRVGRGKDQSYCIMINGGGNKENQRLDIMNRSNDGFEIAGEDLKLRGPGDFFGIRQSGLLEFQVGDIFTDAEVLKEASEAINLFGPYKQSETVNYTL